MMLLEVGLSTKLKARGSLRPVFECPAWFENSAFRGVLKFERLVFKMML